jgi:hypothetical protein
MSDAETVRTGLRWGVDAWLDTVPGEQPEKFNAAFDALERMEAERDTLLRRAETAEVALSLATRMTEVVEAERDALERARQSWRSELEEERAQRRSGEEWARKRITGLQERVKVMAAERDRLLNLLRRAPRGTGGDEPWHRWWREVSRAVEGTSDE